MFRPMLATNADLDMLDWSAGYFASIKLDGIRAIVRKGQLLSRSLKPIPNMHISAVLSKASFEGLDGELIVGPTNSPTCYRDTVSGVMTENKKDVDWNFYVFDKVEDRPFYDRYKRMLRTVSGAGVRLMALEQVAVHDIESLNKFEANALEAGHEGVILRHPDSPYKFGRSTAKEGFLLKVKRMLTDECVVLGVVEEMHNGNEATTNELGRTKRSSHKENKVGKGRMGALHVRDINSGVEFHIGTGFTEADRIQMWINPPIGALVSYNHFPIGRKDLPRHPSFKGLRSKLDL
jgi:DNA ligase-1